MQPRKINEHVLLRYHGATSTDSLIYNVDIGSSSLTSGVWLACCRHILVKGNLCALSQQGHHDILSYGKTIQLIGPYMQRFYVTGRFDVQSWLVNATYVDFSTCTISM